ncbi:aspartate-semialdehyde dehydrogenase [Carnobacterium viridans]|uniref:Aspartate-semialdehyde dehydrogenase n=1 Tax=Carnobacterium viridans TaxID=174587 RepID=A0A1H0XR94_9LACT|nr:aspartate-semialdehyde dehydrogenase [Carnobacterium viridans]UDE95586.1 aspartate-semialdehyde dehydrogenase [Carnobacterium viridans]SDQ05468.1 aspartate semialdehyde dehydrogenase [Carnobacterium viridans]
MNGYTIAVVGATGAVGTKMIQMLEQANFPINEVKLLASKRSAGKKALFNGKEIEIQETTADSFENVDIALFSAGGSISKQFAPEAVERGAVVIDNTSAYRMDAEVPLVVPEVNEEAIRSHKGIIANPNCSTIQMMVALEPIRKQYGLDRVIVSTYQAVSGAGVSAVKEMKEQAQHMLNDEPYEAAILPSGGDKKHFPIAFNALPQIDLFTEDGYTFEELKMINETKKIMGDDHIKVSATCVRIPVVSGHSESVYIEVKEDGASVASIQELMKNAPGVELQDDPDNQVYPTALEAEGKKETFVGRIRKDRDLDKGYHMWIVSDNLIKGAAWNSVQIAESLHKLKLIKTTN